MPDNKSLAGGGSSLFSGFRVLGLYSNHVGHAVRFHQKHREFYLLTAAGRSFHTYNVRLFTRLQPLLHPITLCGHCGVQRRS